METDYGREFEYEIILELMKDDNIERYSRYTFERAAVAERFKITIRNLLEDLYWKNGNAIWMMNILSFKKSTRP